MFRTLLIVSCGLAALLGSGSSAEAQLWNITNKESGLALTARGYPYGAGQLLIQTPRTPANPLQCWRLQAVGGNAYQIINPATGLALEVLGGRDRTFVELHPPRAANSQYWYISNSGNHVVICPLLHAGKALDVPNATHLVSAIQIYKLHAKDNQLWLLTPGG